VVTQLAGGFVDGVQCAGVVMVISDVTTPPFGERLTDIDQLVGAVRTDDGDHAAGFDFRDNLMNEKVS